MNQTIILRSKEHRQRALMILEALPLDPLHEIRLCEHLESRSAAQKGLYFDWITRMANEIGDTKDGLHIRCKRKFFLPVYIRDKTQPYYDTFLTVEAVKEHDKPLAKRMWENVVRMTSTNDASVKQFAECLNDLEKQAISLAIYLPHPGEYNLAMGIKQAPP